MLLPIGKTEFPVEVLRTFEVSSLAIKVPGLPAPLSLRMKCADHEVFRRVLIEDEYDHHLPPDPRVIIDAGAHVGYSVAWFRTWFPNAMIIAIEPDPENFQRLQANCGALTNVHLIRAALWAEDTTVSLVHSGDQGELLESCGTRTVQIEGQPGDTPALSLNTVIETYGLDRVDILKLDIEGAEKVLFDAADLRCLDRVDCIAVRTHDDFRDGCSQATSAALAGRFRRYAGQQNKTFYFRREPPPPARVESGPRHVWLVGDGRSGSTWLSAVLNCKSRFAEYFEPWHVRFVPELENEPMIPYVRPGHVPERYWDFYARVFRKGWSSHRSGPLNRNGAAVLVKDIHALLLARAVSQEMPMVDVVCIIRDPVEVAKSKLARDHWHWFRDPAVLLKDAQLRQDWLLPFEQEIIEARTPFQRHVVVWAIMYHVFTRQFGPGEVTYLPYAEPPVRLKAKIDRILQRASFPPLGEDEFDLALKQRAWTDIGAIQTYVPTESEIAYAARIVTLFGLDALVAGLTAERCADVV